MQSVLTFRLFCDPIHLQIQNCIELTEKMDNFIVGTCESMCPLDEMKMRTKEKLIHFYERRSVVGNCYEPDPKRMVKEFARSAAGVRAPRARDLRTPKALKQTVDYLLTEIVSDNRKPFNVAYDFIFDRLRAVRQEIVMQNLSESLTIELLEPMIMFLVYSLYRLTEELLDKFDPKICRQHLQECLKKVLTCYDALDDCDTDLNARKTFNREIIESIYLLFNLGDAEALCRALHLPQKVRGDSFCEALKISLSFWVRDYHKCLTRIPKLPHILCATATLHLQNIRREILHRFSAGYQSKILTVPLDWLSKVLLYDSVAALVTDCKYYGLNVDHKLNTAKFARADFNQSIAIIKPRHEKFVENQLPSESISQLLLLELTSE